MKISEMTTDQATIALIRIAGPLGRICDDEELVGMLGDFSKMENVGVVRAVGRILPQITSYALQKHKEDVYEIIGALSNNSTSKIAKMNFIEVINIIKDSYDEVLRDFFTRSIPVQKKSAD